MSSAANAKPVVAVIGGGYAGMAAAVTLAEAGIGCSVFEAGKTLGGRARRIEYRGEVIDNGQHILVGAYTELLRLMCLVGVANSSLRRVPLTLSIPPGFLLRATRTALLPGSLQLAWALLSAKGLSLADKLAAIRFMQALKRNKFHVDASMSIATLLAELKQPQNLIDHLWQPLTISAMNTPLGSASAQVFANVLRDSLASRREASDLLLPCADLSALFPEPAAGWLAHRGCDVRAGVRIKQILATGGQYEVISESGSQHFDGVILAVGPHQLAGLMANVAPPALSYEPIVTIYFKFDRHVRMCEAMSGQTRSLVQWFFDRKAMSDFNSPGSSPRQSEGGLIAAVISASGPHNLLSQEELAERVLGELRRHIPDLPKPVWHKVVTEKFATFACTPHADRPTAATCYPGVFRAGDYVAGDYPATLEGAVRNGIGAAKASIGYLACLTSFVYSQTSTVESIT